MTDQEQHAWYEYKVRANIQFPSMDSCAGDTTIEGLETRWLDYRGRAINLARELREEGYSVEILTRERGAYAPKDFDKLPERGGA